MSGLFKYEATFDEDERGGFPDPSALFCNLQGRKQNYDITEVDIHGDDNNEVSFFSDKIIEQLTVTQGKGEAYTGKWTLKLKPELKIIRFDT